MYMTFIQKPACIREFWKKTCMYMRLLGKNMRIQRRKWSKVGQGSNPSRGVSMDEHTTKCDTETGRNREKFKHIVYPIPKEKTTRNLPNGVANSVTERNFLWPGVYHNRLNDTRNQSIPLCKINKYI